MDSDCVSLEDLLVISMHIVCTHVHSLHTCRYLSDVDNSKEEVRADLRIPALGYWHSIMVLIKEGLLEKLLVKLC